MTTLDSYSLNYLPLYLTNIEVLKRNILCFIAPMPVEIFFLISGREVGQIEQICSMQKWQLSPKYFFFAGTACVCHNYHMLRNIVKIFLGSWIKSMRCVACKNDYEPFKSYASFGWFAISSDGYFLNHFFYAGHMLLSHGYLKNHHLNHLIWKSLWCHPHRFYFRTNFVCSFEVILSLRSHVYRGKRQNLSM